MTDKIAIMVQEIPTAKALYFMPIIGIKAAKIADIKFNEPLAILGTVVATVARKFVPNCSAAIVTKIAQNPTEIPNRNIQAYNTDADEKGKSK